MRLIIAFCVVLLTHLACSVSPQSEDRDSYVCENSFNITSQVHPKKTQLDLVLEKYQKQGLPGVAMLIKDADGFWLGRAGYADISAKAPFEACTLTRIGSVSKTFMSALTLRLVDQGVVNLSDKAADYLDADLVQKIANLDVATIEQLLNNTSGIVNYTEVQGWGLDAIGSMDRPGLTATNLDALEYIYGLDSYFAAGTNFHYSNSNFLLLGMVLSTAMDKSLKDLMQEQVFIPLSMNNSFFDPEVHYRKGQAQGYVDLYGDGTLRNNTHSIVGGGINGDGGIVTNVFDLYTFTRGIVDVNTGFLSQAAIDAMQNWTEFSYSEDVDGYYGLGFSVTTTEYGEQFGHSGGMLLGYSAKLRYHPDHDTVTILVTNSFYGNTDDIIDGIMAESREIMFGTN